MCSSQSKQTLFSFKPIGYKTKTTRDFSRAFHWLHIFPRFSLVTSFPALFTGYIFSRAFHWLHIFPRFSLVTYFPALGSAHVLVFVNAKTSRKHKQIRKINLTNLKCHELVVRFWSPRVNFNLVFRCNGKKFDAMEIYCNTKNKSINVLFVFEVFFCRKMLMCLPTL